MLVARRYNFACVKKRSNCTTVPRLLSMIVASPFSSTISKENDTKRNTLFQPRPQGAFPWLWRWRKSALGTRLTVFKDWALCIIVPTAFSRGGSRIFFRRGCTRLLLYFNTNKPHSFFFLQNTSCIRKPQVISGGGGGAHPLHPPSRSAPVFRKEGKTPGNEGYLENHTHLAARICIIVMLETGEYNILS